MSVTLPRHLHLALVAAVTEPATDLSIQDWQLPTEADLRLLTIPQLLSLSGLRVRLLNDHFETIQINRVAASKEKLIEQIIICLQRIQSLVLTHAPQCHLHKLSEAQEQFMIGHLATVENRIGPPGVLLRVGLVAPDPTEPARIVCYAQRLLEPDYTPEWLIVQRDGTAHVMVMPPSNQQWLLLIGEGTIKRPKYWVKYHFNLDRYFFKLMPIVHEEDDARFSRYAAELDYALYDPFKRSTDQQYEGYPKVRISHSSSHHDVAEAELFIATLAKLVGMAEAIDQFTAHPVKFIESHSVTCKTLTFA